MLNRVMERLTADRLGDFIAENADLTCRLITDDLNWYEPVGKAFRGGHAGGSVHERRDEYVRKGTDVAARTPLKRVFSLIKRGVMSVGVP